MKFYHENTLKNIAPLNHLKNVVGSRLGSVDIASNMKEVEFSALKLNYENSALKTAHSMVYF